MQTQCKKSIFQLRLEIKRQLVERMGLERIVDMISHAHTESVKEELRINLFAILNSEYAECFSSYDKTQCVEDIINEIIGLGPLQPLLDDEEVTEIMVNGCRSLFYERKGTLERMDEPFENDEQIMLILDRILSPLGRRVDESMPLVNARLENGYRVHAVIAPIALDGPTITIRKFSGQITSLDALVQRKALPAWYAKLLSWAVKLRQDIAVAGGTGSGKTTLLNALSTQIDEHERILTIEDSAELKFDTHPHVVRLEAREASIEGKGAVGIHDLVRNALRMRPDRIIVGEVRGEECIDMLQAMNTGHDGSLTTLHAGSAQEAILRLILMARFGMDLPADIIEEQVATALDLLVMSQRLADGRRCIGSLSAVTREENGKVALHTLVSFEAATYSWCLQEVPQFILQAQAQHILDEKEVSAWKQSCQLA